LSKTKHCCKLLLLFEYGAGLECNAGLRENQSEGGNLSEYMGKSKTLCQILDLIKKSRFGGFKTLQSNSGSQHASLFPIVAAS